LGQGQHPHIAILDLSVLSFRQKTREVFSMKFPACFVLAAVSLAAFPYVYAQSSTFSDYPSSQFWWLRLLAGLLHIPKWRGSEEMAVFTGEL
jgi:hypothetical protein